MANAAPMLGGCNFLPTHALKLRAAPAAERKGAFGNQNLMELSHLCLSKMSQETHITESKTPLLQSPPLLVLLLLDSIMLFGSA